MRIDLDIRWEPPTCLRSPRSRVVLSWSWVGKRLRVGRKWLLVFLIHQSFSVAADRSSRRPAEAPRMAAHKLAALLGRLFRKGLDVFVPRHHGVVALGPEDPRVSAMHPAGLAALENKLVRRPSLVRMGAYFLLWQIERHDGRLGLVRRLELVKMRGGKYIPENEKRKGPYVSTLRCPAWPGGVTHHPAV